MVAASVTLLVGGGAASAVPAPIEFGSISAQVSNQATTDGSHPCFTYSPSTGSDSTGSVTSPREAEAGHGYPANRRCSSTLSTHTQSVLGIAPSDVDNMNAGASFLLGTATHYNNPIASDAGTHYTGDLSLSLAGATFTVPWKLWETPNEVRFGQECANGESRNAPINSNGCADEIQFLSQASKTTVTVRGVRYTLIYDGFFPANGSSCPAQAPSTTKNDFWTKEQSTTTACIYGSFEQVRTLTVRAATNPAGVSAPGFGFTSTSDLNGTPWDGASFSLDPNGTNSRSGVVTNNEHITVTESQPADWHLDSISCSGINSNQYSVSGGTLTIGSVPAGNGDIVCTFTSGARASGLTVVKSATVNGSAASYTKVGDVVDYAFRVHNTGDVAVNSIAIHDAMLATAGDAISCPQSSLAIGASQTCTAEYRVTQSDLTAGSISNTAYATGTTPGNTPVRSPNSSVVVPEGNNGALTFTKSATVNGSGTTYSKVGDVIDYTFRVHNVGTVPVTSLQIHDSMLATAGSAVSCPSFSLAAGAAEDCTAQYTVRQADLNAGSISNTAYATGTTPGNTPVRSPNSSVTIPEGNNGGMSVVKSATVNGTASTFTKVGDVIDYSFAVTNTGSTPVSSIEIHDAMFPSGVTCPSTTLAAGGSQVCTAKHTIDQADIDAGKVTNSAYATGRNPGNNPVTSGTSTVTVLEGANGGLSVVKSATVNGTDSTFTKVGDKINYTFTVTNTGDVALHSITIHDAMFTGSNAVGCPSGPLAAGKSEVCRATHTVTQADIDTGSITNSAYATGLTPGDDTVTSGASGVTINAGAVGGVSTHKPTTTPPAVGPAVTSVPTGVNAGQATTGGDAAAIRSLGGAALAGLLLVGGLWLYYRRTSRQH